MPENNSQSLWVSVNNMDTKGNNNAEWYIINTKGIQRNDECMASHGPESFHPSERIRWSLHSWCVLVVILMGWLFHKRKECKTKAMRKKYFKAHWIKCYCACCAKMLQSCLTLFNLMDCSPPGCSIHGILQARILEWVAISSSKGSSWPRDWTCVSYTSCTGRQVCLFGFFSPLTPPGKSNLM